MPPLRALHEFPTLTSSAIVGLATLHLSAQPPIVPSDVEIRQILIDRIDRNRQSVGIVVGLIDARGRRVITYGAVDKGDSRPLNGDTVFEIGSVTNLS
jgi:serine-type D-Ala-D-Ala carboxypeptidase/endopeptidase